jgi:hypothetical protein
VGLAATTAFLNENPGHAFFGTTNIDVTSHIRDAS